METVDDADGVQAFLSAYDSLSESDKDRARQLILSISTDKAATSLKNTGNQNATCSSTEDSHSCHICKELHLSRIKNHIDDLNYVHHPGPRYLFQSTELVLTKDLLSQERSRACPIVKWIFEFLQLSLAAFKTDLREKNLLPVTHWSGSITGQPIDNLLYIHSKGVRTRIYCSGLGTARIQLSYKADPHLLDKLWGASTTDRFDNDGYEQYLSKYSRSTTKRVRISTTAAAPSIPDLPIRSTYSTRTPDYGFELAMGWVQNCQEKHPNCFRRSGLLPTRVIDVGHRLPIRTARLHWTEEGEEGQYAALSYCWGGQQPVTTTHRTAQDNTDGILFCKIPQTIQDAMTVTLKLGLRYLWIDCLCIIQDDPEDVAREVASMAQIFEQAFITISAASAASVHEGFLARRRDFREIPLKLPFHSEDPTEGFVLLEGEEEKAHNPTNDPINLRAWTLQEHILSSRMLVYSTDKLWWTCEHQTTSQSKVGETDSYAPTRQSKSDPERYTLIYWRSIVQDYSRRFLTYSSDKLPALAGVAAQYGRIFPGRYLAGLWESNLVNELMWCSIRSDITRPLAQRAPSWSWVSVDGEVHHHWCSLLNGRYEPRIEYCQVVPMSLSSPYGPIDMTRSVLRLTGEMIAVCWSDDREQVFRRQRKPWFNKLSGETEMHEIARCSVGHTQVDAAETLPTEGRDTIVWVLPLMKEPIRGLLLFNLGDDEYKRVGLVTRMWDQSFYNSHFETKTINIW